MVLSKNVVVAGHICLDIIPPFQPNSHQDIIELFQPGKLLNVGEVVLCTGGAVSNTGIALSKLGCQVAFMSKVGDDTFGKIISEKMSEWGDVKSIVYDSYEGSSYTIVLAPPSIDRMFLHHPGCNDYFTSQNINWEIVASSRLFHLGYPPVMRSLFINDGKELSRILKKVKSLGVSTSVDMTLPDPDSEAGRLNWIGWMKNVLPYVDFFTPSIEEALLLWNRSEWQTMRTKGEDFINTVPIDVYQDIANDLIVLGCGVVILKAGHRGIYVRVAGGDRLGQISVLPSQAHSNWAERELWGAPYVTEKIVSATGAGDSAVAGILAAVLHGKTLEETLQFGNCLGYQNLRALDTVSGVGTYEETESLIKILEPVAIDFLDKAWVLTSFKGIWER